MKIREVRAVLGIDVSKLTFDVALLSDSKEKRQKFKNSLSGFKELESWLQSAQATDVHVCMEASGRYYEGLAEFLYSNNYLVSVVNAAKIKGHAKAELMRLKTDALDASLIARFCQKHVPPAWKPLSPEIREVQEAERYLSALKSMKIQETNRLQSGLISESVKSVIASHVEYMNMQIANVEKLLKQLVKQNEKLAKHHKLITSVIGLGDTTAFIWLGEVGYCETFVTSRQLEAFTGLSTKRNQSGTSVQGRERLCKVGNHYLRKALYMPALSALRSNPAIMEFAARLKQRGKPAMVIVGAVMRKLLRIIFAVIKSGKEFDCLHQSYPPIQLAI